MSRSVTISFPKEATWFDRLIGNDKEQEVFAAGQKAAAPLPSTDEVVYQFDSEVSSMDVFTKGKRFSPSPASKIDDPASAVSSGALPHPPKSSGLFDDDDDTPSVIKEAASAGNSGLSASSDTDLSFSTMSEEEKRRQHDYSSVWLLEAERPAPKTRPAVAPRARSRGLFDEDDDDEDLDIFGPSSNDKASAEAEDLFKQAERVEERARQQRAQAVVVTTVSNQSAISSPAIDQQADLDDLFSEGIKTAPKPSIVGTAAQLNSVDDVTAYLDSLQF